MPPRIQIPTDIPPSTAGVAITPVTFTAEGGPLTWRLSGGALPPGMTFDVATGVYSGTPTALGSYAFTVQVTDSGGSDSIELTHVIVAPPANAHMLLGANRIAALNLEFPSVAGTPVTVTNIVAGEALVSIGRRPQNGMLYGLGVDANANTMTLYGIATATGFATPVGASSSGFTTNGTTVVDLPPNGYAMDFDPANDRLRVVASSLNFRINPNTGRLVDGDNGNAPTTGTNPDRSINGGTATVGTLAYTNNVPNDSITTLYTVDTTTNQLFIQNPPNGGAQTLVQALTPSGTKVHAFDIVPGVNASTSNAPVATGQAYAIATLDGQSVESLVRIDLVNAQVTDAIALPTTGALALAVNKPLSLPVLAFGFGGALLFRFSTTNPSATPNGSTATGLGILAPGETLAAIDIRPHTGQLYGLGVNATANTGTLYVIDPQIGAVSIVGSASIIAFVDAGGNPVDFPDLATTAYAIDFDPSVDRIRVITETGLNFRVDPNSGAPVDGNLDSGTPAGTNTDASLNGGATSAAGIAYTNDPGSLSGGTTTAYVIDRVSKKLLRMRSPNAGELVGALSITVGGTPVAFTEVGDFDIPTRVSVPTPDEPPSEGTGYAVLTVAGSTHLYAIDLVTGAATDLGAISNGGLQIFGMTVGTTAL